MHCDSLCGALPVPGALWGLPGGAWAGGTCWRGAWQALGACAPRAGACCLASLFVASPPPGLAATPHARLQGCKGRGAGGRAPSRLPAGRLRAWRVSLFGCTRRPPLPGFRGAAAALRFVAAAARPPTLSRAVREGLRGVGVFQGVPRSKREGVRLGWAGRWALRLGGQQRESGGRVAMGGGARGLRAARRAGEGTRGAELCRPRAHERPGAALEPNKARRPRLARHSVHCRLVQKRCFPQAPGHRHTLQTHTAAAIRSSARSAMASKTPAPAGGRGGTAEGSGLKLYTHPVSRGAIVEWWVARGLSGAARVWRPAGRDACAARMAEWAGAGTLQSRLQRLCPAAGPDQGDTGKSEGRNTPKAWNAAKRRWMYVAPLSNRLQI